MSNHKVLSAKDTKSFVKTASFLELCNALKSLKTSKGRFLHVLGTPGTGKSANIYSAISQLNMDVYEAYLFIDMDTKPHEVYHIFWDTIKNDMGAKNKREVYQKAALYDLILFADPFLDSEYIDKDKVGLGLWTEEHGPSTAPFYFRVLNEYLKHRQDLKEVNVVTQTAWILKFRGIKYDILTDFYFLSKILVFLLKLRFDVVEISYSKKETMEIIRSHPRAGSDEEIEELIKKYGTRPRFIFEALDEKK